MLSRKKRDAKFLIFQSLYIIAISILFYKGTDLSLVRVVDANDSLNAYVEITDTVVTKEEVDLLKLNNAVVDIERDSIIDRNLLAQITQRANENVRNPVIPPVRLPDPPKQEEKVAEEKKKEEKIDKPSPVPKKDVTEYSNQSFTNPSSEKKLLVYQNGSLLGVVAPGGTRTLRIRSGGNITYGYSD